MLYLIFLFIFGTVIGSFLNVCIHRLPRGKSIVYPASHCPQCRHKLTVLDLLPLLSYFLLGGKCRYCKAPISFRYPLVEFVTGAFLVAAALNFPVGSVPLHFGFYLIFILFMILIFFTDLEQQVIPDAANFSGIFFGLIFNFLKGSFLSALYGMLLGYLLLYLVARLGKIWLKKEAMGEGDLYLAALLGAYLGWQGMLLAVFAAYLLAGIVSLVLLAAGKIKMGGYVPFAPALAAGGIITLFFGRQLINWYLTLFL